MNKFQLSIGLGVAALVSSLAVGFAPAQAVKPVPPGGTPVVEPCSIWSKVIPLGHDRWKVNARLYRAGKRYPRHALTLNKIGVDGVVTPLATAVGNKKVKWNWRMTGPLVAGETLQVHYDGDAATQACDGAVLTPKLRPAPVPTSTAPAPTS